MFTLRTLKSTYWNVFLSMIFMLQVSTTSISEPPGECKAIHTWQTQISFLWSWIHRAGKDIQVVKLLVHHQLTSLWLLLRFTNLNNSKWFQLPFVIEILQICITFCWHYSCEPYPLMCEQIAYCWWTCVEIAYHWHVCRLHTIDMCADCISWLSDRRAGMGGHNSFSTCKWNCENQHNGLAWSIRIHKHHRILASTVISNCKGTEIH